MRNRQQIMKTLENIWRRKGSTSTPAAAAASPLCLSSSRSRTRRALAAAAAAATLHVAAPARRPSGATGFPPTAS
ncbi:unnamed protein product [Merluccius merluccius]